MPSGSLVTLSMAQISHRSALPERDRSISDPALCRSVIDQILRQTIISRLRLAHTEAAFDDHRAAGSQQSRPLRQPPPVDTSLITRLSLRLRRGEQPEIDSLADIIIRKHGLEAFFAIVAPQVDATLRRQADDPSGELQNSSLGQWRLQELLHRLTPRFQNTRSVLPHGRRALLVSPEPAQHALDLQITAECLSREGWDVLCEEQNLASLVELAQRKWFELLMVTADEGRLDRVAGIIRSLRRAACNPHVKVLVLSEVLARRPDRLARLGADAAAANIGLACSQARRLFSLLPAQA